MAFSYDFNTNPTIATVRMIVADTDDTPPYPIWQDIEIQAALNMFSSQNIIVGLSGYNPAVPPAQVFSYRRAAALLLRSLGGLKARLMVTKLLDVQVAGGVAASALRGIADDLVTSEENDGYFAVAEMVQDPFSMRERLWKQLYRFNNT